MVEVEDEENWETSDEPEEEDTERLITNFKN